MYVLVCVHPEYISNVTHMQTQISSYDIGWIKMSP